MINKAAFVVFSFLMACPVLAGVYKCVDEQGKVIFTDSACSTNTTITKVEINVANTLDSSTVRKEIHERQIKEEFEQYQQPERRSRVTVLKDDTKDINSNKRSMDRARRVACDEAITPYKASPNGQLTKRQRAMASACSQGASFNEVERISNEHKQYAPTPSSAPGIPAIITNCDGTGCWDTQGNRYNNADGGNAYRQDGAFCQQIGNGFVCN